MSVINATPLLAAAGGDYQISRSVRLRSSASAYFNRTPASTTNQKTWTFSCWMKRGTLGTNGMSLISAGTSNSNGTSFYFSSDQLIINNIIGGGSQGAAYTPAVLRDPSAWYHIVLSMDTTQTSFANGWAKIFINGVQQTLTQAAAPTQNSNTFMNLSTNAMWIARDIINANYFDGYLTEVNFIDGQALTPSSFGETDSITGVWKPKKYAGTYGTNGFYLNFSDNSSNTATTIGKDYSGNGNNWTPNNISVTAGVSYDSMVDVPTMWADGGNGRGNYCTWNPLVPGWSGSLTGYPEANLSIYGAGTQRVIGTQQFPTTGKWYYEINGISYGTSGGAYIGVTTNPTDPAVATICMYVTDGTKYVNGSSSAYGATYGSASSNTDVIGVAVDNDAGTVTFYKNNVSQGAITHGLGNVLYPSMYKTGVNAGYAPATFGQRPFSYTPPSGFKALNTQNLPEPTIKKGNQYFDVSLYTGNGTSQSVVNSGGFQPDLVWVKERSGTRDHRLVDAVRGVGKELYSSLTFAEATDAAGLTSFNSNGYSIGSSVGYNANGVTQVGWQWKESPSAGFDIVTYTGTGSATTVAHNLGVAPSMMIVKLRSGTGSPDGWGVYHASLGNTKALTLETTSAAGTSSTYWNSTSPTSSVFSIGTWSRTNNNGGNYVAYLFAEVAGFSKFGSYTGNGSTDGPFVFCGFRPKFVLIKSSSAAGTWTLWDSSRSTANSTNLTLAPNSSAAESSSINIDFLSNGFKVRHVGDINASSVTSIFAAFAENPFKNSLAR